MEEEVTQKTIALCIRTTKLTADILKAALHKFLAAQNQKGKNPYIQGKQSVKQLVRQNAGVSNIEINDKNIRSFERIARKYAIDYAVKKDRSVDPPRYLIFFKGRDTDVMNQAFREYVGKQMTKQKKPTIREKLAQYRAAAKNHPKKQRKRVRQKNRRQSI